MSQFPKPPEIPIGPGDPTDPFLDESRPKRWSALAIAAFVLSLVACVPAVPLLGLALGIAGLSATSGGKRRGRGLAIAAIPVSVVATAIGALLLMGMFSAKQFSALFENVKPLLQASAGTVSDASDTLYLFTTEDFQAAVSPGQLQSWALSVIEENGKLVELALSPDQTGAQETGELLFKANFVNGQATLRLKLDTSYAWFYWTSLLDDIVIRGSSPRDFAAGQPEPEGHDSGGESDRESGGESESVP